MSSAKDSEDFNDKDYTWSKVSTDDESIDFTTQPVKIVPIAKSPIIAIIGGALGGIVLILLIELFVWLGLRKKESKEVLEVGDSSIEMKPTKKNNKEVKDEKE
jgi:hypothetical protein